MFVLDTRILAVDDAKTHRQLIRSSLKDLGYSNVDLVVDGQQAIQALKRGLTETRPYDLIISDVQMPNMSGLELLHYVRHAYEKPKTPFILITGEGDNDTVVKAIKDGVSSYIMKPYSAKTLEDRLRKVYAQVRKAEEGGT